ncbi:ABC transporter permease [Streptomyces spongiae]|uniref:ABC transporter permease n=1 Tax=Streptomyces spongiae TaxID=565072 RepID=A0A5N8XCB5_9ACTN|nr:ABC transporter permease [Streptomyces spongiae]
MARFVARRLVMLVATLFTSSFVIFGALYLAPGDAVSTLSGSRTLSPQAVAALREQYHLDDPFLARYFQWLGDTLLHGDLGTSITYREDVSSVIAARMGVTFQLVLYAALIIVVVGVGLGLLSGLRGGVVDTSILVVTTVFAAVPSFVAATVLLSAFAVGLGWFPAVGTGEGLAGTLWHLTLPAVALALASLAIVSRITRVAVRTELGREHVQTAISRGIPYPALVRRHVLRNASIPVTTVVGITIASLFGMSAVVEQTFGLGGLGSALVEASLARDVAVVQGVALVFVTAFVVVNTLVDVAYAVLDPRVKAGSRAS